MCIITGKTSNLGKENNPHGYLLKNILQKKICINILLQLILFVFKFFIFVFTFFLLYNICCDVLFSVSMQLFYFILFQF